jgi:hypothetical protein
MQRMLGSPRRRRCAVVVEPLEPRRFLAAIAVNASQVVRQVNPQVLATNLAWWGGDLGSAQTRSLAQAAGLTLYRFPGGSASDSFHFTDPPAYNGYNTIPSFAKFVAAQNAAGMSTVDYGSGSPQEAAALLAYLNGSTSNASAIGSGQIWDSSTSTWVQKDWKTASYWATLRASTPLGSDDGLNFLRINHAAPFAIHYWEIGNEEYGVSWETDHHGSGGDAGKAHDPATYIAFAKQFAGFAAAIDPTTSIGVDSGSISFDNNWTPNILTQCAAQGFTPGFISDHVYMQAPGSESDATLLFHTVSDPNAQNAGSPFNWSQRATAYRNLLNQKLGGATAANVQLLNTEFNSVYSNPGKQTTSLVNGLFVADSIGSIFQTEYNASIHWDLHNGFDTANNNAASLYGWRQGGDYGLLGSGGTAPASGNNVPYPTYFAEQLLSKMVHSGDTVVRAASNDINIATYAVKQANGHLDLLVINKNATTDLAGSFSLTGFLPAVQAQFWQYGKTQDTAQSLTTDGHSALAGFSAALTLSGGGSGFSYTFHSYSMTAIDLAPAAQVLARDVFYNNSAFDGNDAAANSADDNAIASDKGALLPGQAATSANYTTYSRGLNGVMIDIANLGDRAALGASDFTFSVGTTTDPGTWSAALAPTTIAVRNGAGTSGSDRIEIVWADNALQNQWLQVTVKADGNTGLTAPDVFYFGNLIGDGNGSGSVTVADIAMAKSQSGQSATITAPTDFNRSGQVTVADIAIAKAYEGGSLVMLSAPAAAIGVAPLSAEAARSPFSTVMLPPNQRIVPWVRRKRIWRKDAEKSQRNALHIAAWRA